MTYTIGFFVGSLREGSYNKLVAKTFAELLPEGFEAQFFDIGSLPLYNEDLDHEPHIPAVWTEFRAQVVALDGVAFFTPEYNRSVPAALKNALDVASRPGGKSVWGNKPGLVVSTSISPLSGFGANHHLRQTLSFLDIAVMPSPEVYIGQVRKLITEDGRIIPETVEFFEKVMASYIAFFTKLKAE